MNADIYILLGGVLTVAVLLRADLRRRRLSLKQAVKGRVLLFLDVLSSAVTGGLALGLGIQLVLTFVFDGGVHGFRAGSRDFFGFGANAAMFAFLWREGHRQIQFQRPRGIVFAEWLILFGVIVALGSLLSKVLYPAERPYFVALGVTFVISGVVIIAKIVPPFVKKGSEYHRILKHLVEEGESVQAEYAAPTPECPEPGQWKMVDSQTTELEVLDFLKILVTTLKPELILETGTFLGYGTIKLAEGARANGFGRVITIENDPVIYAKARERIEAAGLGDWVECRNESSLETKIEGTIDFYFSDSALAIREQEIRRLLPQLDQNGLLAIHDASSQFKTVREAAFRMEQEGLLSVVLLSTPRGLVLAQKQAGRK